ncbi:hypothetical protein [Flavobacterium sp. CSZ]|uniref:hypothetical protein n=1 Tax=Flavobacterium sp. CSZ TaxID=2783791 RepID=UPI00188AE5B1|nr:hypothetical protein [Flavobacterium sp. CSZ]MBF4484375.1 hypothetical protein [Flavobacterium sp. CSZ]
MALQTLNTIKQWFKTGLKPSQQQFWDTWDSFRHKFEKVPVKDIEGIDELLLSKADKVVLDNHLADKIAHAPQVNTDWNSESGFSQLFNKPEFKTINGEPLTGGGDIVIEAGGAQNLQTTLGNGNETTNSIMFNDDYYNWLKTSIDSRSIRLTDSNSNLLAGIDSAGVFTHDDSQHVSINPQGIFFNRDTAESYLRINTSSTGVSTINLPVTEGTEITLAAKEDFKTINGEEIVGEGDITISSAIPTLDQVLNSDNKSLTQPIVFLDEEYSATIDSKNLSIDGPLGEGIQYNGDNINWSKGEKNLKLLFDGKSAGQNTFTFPEMPDSSAPYKLATDQVVSATQSGIVNNTPLQELGGVDKIINLVRIGRGAGAVNNSTALGYTALSLNTTGTNNTAIGASVLSKNTTGIGNTGVGALSLRENAIGTYNTGLGYGALRTNIVGFNTAVGAFSLYNFTTGLGYNTALGVQALAKLTTGNSNTAIGSNSLNLATNTTFNTAVGSNSLYNLTTGGKNVGIGNDAGSAITTGEKNTALGYLALGGATVTNTGSSNIAIGYQAGRDLTSGSANILLETQEGGTVSSGSNNIVINSGKNNAGIKTGNCNTIVGGITGLPTDASNLVILSDGSGNIAIRKETDGRLLAPTLTNTLIDSGGNKSLVTKEYLDAHSGGTTPTLDQVLGSGNESTDKSIMLTGSGGRSMQLDVSNALVNMEDSEGKIELQASNTFPLIMTNKTTDNEVKIGSDVIISTSTVDGVPYSKQLTFSTNPLGNYEVVLPAKTGTVALRSDFKTVNGESILGTGNVEIGGGSQDLQQTLDNGASYTSLDTSLNIDFRSEPWIEKKSTTLAPYLGYPVQTGLFSMSENGVTMQSEDVGITQPDVYKNGAIGSTNGNPTMSVQLNRLNEDGSILGSSMSILRFEDNTNLSGTVAYEIPAKVNGDNLTYKLATTDDITLQKLIDTNKNTATKASSTISLLEGGESFVSNQFLLDNGVSGSGHRFTSMQQYPDVFTVTNSYNDGDKQSILEMNLSTISLMVKRDMLSGTPKSTNLSFAEPTSPGVEILIPAKPLRAEAYTIATLDDILPKISRISDDFTIPDGYATRFITVLAINKTITLPNVTDSVGAIFYITGNPLGNTIINCKNRNLQILYQGNLESDYEIQANDGVTLINDGTNYIVTSKYP